MGLAKGSLFVPSPTNSTNGQVALSAGKFLSPRSFVRISRIHKLYWEIADQAGSAQDDDDDDVAELEIEEDNAHVETVNDMIDPINTVSLLYDYCIMR